MFMIIRNEPRTESVRMEAQGTEYQRIDKETYILRTANALREKDSNIITLVVTYCKEVPAQSTCLNCIFESRCRHGIKFRKELS